MADYVVYDKRWDEIPEQDWPEPGAVYVCKDPQERLGKDTWSVSRMGDGTAQGDTETLGLFWDKLYAAIFAKAL